MAKAKIPAFVTPQVVANTGLFLNNDFIQRFARLVERLEAEQRLWMVALLVEVDVLFARIIELTPVDRSPEADAIVAKDLWSKELRRMDANEHSIVVAIMNVAENPYTGYAYPRALEYGHSQQAPHGMIRVAVEEFRHRLHVQIGQTKADLSK